MLTTVIRRPDREEVVRVCLRVLTYADVCSQQRIEELIGKKMLLYATEEDVVLQLSERVGEAQVPLEGSVRLFQAL